MLTRTATLIWLIPIDTDGDAGVVGVDGDGDAVGVDEDTDAVGAGEEPIGIRGGKFESDSLRG